MKRKREEDESKSPVLLRPPRFLMNARVFTPGEMAMDKFSGRVFIVNADINVGGILAFHSSNEIPFMMEMVTEKYQQGVCVRTDAPQMFTYGERLTLSTTDFPRQILKTWEFAPNHPNALYWDNKNKTLYASQCVLSPTRHIMTVLYAMDLSESIEDSKLVPIWNSPWVFGDMVLVNDELWVSNLMRFDQEDRSRVSIAALDKRTGAFLKPILPWCHWRVNHIFEMGDFIVAPFQCSNEICLYLRNGSEFARISVPGLNETHSCIAPDGQGGLLHLIQKQIHVLTFKYPLAIHFLASLHARAGARSLLAQLAKHSPLFDKQVLRKILIVGGLTPPKPPRGENY